MEKHISTMRLQATATAETTASEQNPQGKKWIIILGPKRLPAYYAALLCLVFHASKTLNVRYALRLDFLSFPTSFGLYALSYIIGLFVFSSI